jgi:hypothetical protein
MRFRPFLYVSVLAVALAAPLVSFAQFQAPTDAELKMTDDPKAPGADAVYLYREETQDDNIGFQSVYERIKVLTEKGKDLGTAPGTATPKTAPAMLTAFQGIWKWRQSRAGRFIPTAL